MNSPSTSPKKQEKNALRYFDEPISIEQKTDETPVTIADRSTEELIRKEIETHFPDDGILGEEFGEKPGTSGFRWILDPIDGTKTFIRGVPFFGTLIALEQNGESKIGVIELPALEITVSAMTGFGCYANGCKCQVSQTAVLAEASVMVSDISDVLRYCGENALKQLLTRTALQRTWADCYGYYLVAAGKADIAFDAIDKIWDLAPMIPIIEESGGKITDVNGYTGLSMQSSIASNSMLHPQFLEMLR